MSGDKLIQRLDKVLEEHNVPLQIPLVVKIALHLRSGEAAIPVAHDENGKPTAWLFQQMEG